MNGITLGKIRVQALSCDIIRLEYDKNGRFEDRPTFFVPERCSFTEDVPMAYHKAEGSYVIQIGDLQLRVPEGAKELQGVSLWQGEREVYRYRTIKNSGELPKPGKTPFVHAVMDSPRIICPSHGYSAKSVQNGEKYEISKSAKDIYLLVCRGDAKQLRKQFVSLTGRNEMVRLSTLGSWNSRYYKYTQKEAEEMIDLYREKQVPLDNMVIDTDWRAATERGIGYDINTTLFPDMKSFFDYAHERNVEIMFNDHPEPQEGAKSLIDPKEITFREEKLQGLMELGLDAWWYDRNWTTALASPVKSVLPEAWGMYLFADVTENYYAKRAGNKENHRRPVIMANVNNIQNGTYCKINDSASHRYSIQWSGDIGCKNEALLQEIQNLVRATDNCIPYVNFDCGGHIGNPDKDLYLRWMKFGAFSPVLRPHCNNAVQRYREPWNYDEETLDICREYINMRYRLLPMTYGYAYQNYITGEPIYKSMGLAYPEDKTSLACDKQYMLGDNILVSPIYAEPLMAVPRCNFMTPVKATYYQGCNLEGEPVAVRQYRDVFQEYDKTSPVPQLGPYNYSAVFEFKLKFNSDVEIHICNDDGTRFFLDGELVMDDWKFHYAFPQYVTTLKKGKEYSVRMEYMQGGDKAITKLLYKRVATKQFADETVHRHSFYTPEDGYLNIFNGNIYNKGRHRVRFGAKEYPVFVRSGCAIPLGKTVLNTAEQTWDELAFDIYPSMNRAYSSILYEDDRQTIAYKHGKHRIQPFTLQYEADTNSVNFTLQRAEGQFNGSDSFESRTLRLRYHFSTLPHKIDCITVNGQKVDFFVYDQDKTAYPFGFEGGAPDGSVLEVQVNAPLSDELTVKFYLQ